MTEGHQIDSEIGAVAAEPEAAARIGARILAEGGNAFDAAAATCMAVPMLYPDKTGIGGYMMTAMVRDGATGRIWSVDANSRAPAAAHESMYDILPAQPGGGINESEYACSVRDNANVHGALAVGVPGQLAGIGTLWERWGRLPWAQVVQPSLDLLANGFPYSEQTANSIGNLETVIRRYPATAKHLLKDGSVPTADDIWHRPDMEKTLQHLARAGWRDFYEGELARTMVDQLQAAGGILCVEDLAGFHARVTEPYAARYRDTQIYGCILPNGPLSVLQALNMLDHLPAYDDSDPRWWHQMTEVLKLVWRDRLSYLGDPDYLDVPIERLLSPDYAAGRAESLLQLPERVDGDDWPTGSVDETSHVSAADSHGNVVSATITQGGAFGSCFTIDGWGLILGHGMCRLDPRPGRSNSVTGGKRPLNNVGTMMLRQADRDVALGLPGGRRIIAVMTQMAARLIDADVSLHETAMAPRMHVTTGEPLELVYEVPDPIERGLVQMGHRVTRVERIAGAAHGASFRTSGDGVPVSAGGSCWAAAPDTRQSS
ncbi:MAG: hypothetical protein HN712_19750 [Gemmatimonadetes bacterium]|jgi:gamma-glutamyltranspeptidase / glutathione hydrolase|nr:hypothetical protein [Gemmatimonadota bacterium]MBT6146274.1 hypothetical protein [Gemmatimonadota bacterium]MBT7862558.1 hypothetical protein [Gemmatimonadota bacterium]